MRAANVLDGRFALRQTLLLTGGAGHNDFKGPGLAKLILLLLAVAVAYFLIRNYRRRAAGGKGAAGGRAEETMVRCAECGVHHPRSESLLSAGKFYCSPEHERRSHDA